MSKKSRRVGIALLSLAAILVVYSANKIPMYGRATSSSNEFKVQKVVDGDTIEILKHGRTEKVRLIGVDTPETLDPRKPVQCFGKEASNNTKHILEGQVVRIETDPLVGERDKYNRILAYVWLGNDELINLELVSGGFAHEYTYRSQSYKYQSEFKLAEKTAQANNLGFWSPQTCSGKTK